MFNINFVCLFTSKKFIHFVLVRISGLLFLLLQYCQPFCFLHLSFFENYLSAFFHFITCSHIHTYNNFTLILFTDSSFSLDFWYNLKSSKKSVSSFHFTMPYCQVAVRNLLQYWSICFCYLSEVCYFQSLPTFPLIHIHLLLTSSHVWSCHGTTAKSLCHSLTSINNQSTVPSTPEQAQNWLLFQMFCLHVSSNNSLKTL